MPNIGTRYAGIMHKDHVPLIAEMTPIACMQ